MKDSEKTGKGTLLETLRCYAKILEMTNKSFGVSKNDLLEGLKMEDLEKSERTLERYIKDLENEGIVFERKICDRIKYFKQKNNEENNFLKLINSMVYKSTFIKRENAEYIIWEDEHIEFKNTSFDKLLDAIKEKKVVIFKHHKKAEDDEKDRTESRVILSPYFLKKYNNLWYVIGYAHHRKAIRVYAIDRITDWIGDSEESYCTEKIEDTKRKLAHCIGISHLENPIYKITYEVLISQSYYIKTAPFHNTLTIINETNDKIIFTVDVIDNYELKQKVAWHLGTMTEISRELYQPKQLKKS